ncbi:MAG: hypothetical protein Q4F53_07645 [Nesterenkonia sp.]|nr:hypothetical protein [Nesterenkonia sp.]
MSSQSRTTAAPTSGGDRWRRLAAAADGGALLHGSRTPGLTQLEPRAPFDLSADDYSKQTAVFATEDPTWAIAYAVRDEESRHFRSACFYPGAAVGASERRRIMLDFDVDDDGAPRLSPGVVYILDPTGFSRMPSHHDPEFGLITECQWASPTAARIADAVLVTPEDLPRHLLSRSA